MSICCVPELWMYDTCLKPSGSSPAKRPNGNNSDIANKADIPPVTFTYIFMFLSLIKDFNVHNARGGTDDEIDIG